jgi:DNA topoisomerase I
MPKKEKTLVIVESPAKAKTIEKYLGPDYEVAASMGHLIDLPKSRLAIDVENEFEPEYITVRGKAKILKELQSKVKKSSRVFLASDNDREGEAISFHLRNALLKKKPDIKIERIVFNEITPAAIRLAVANPGELNEDKVNAQKARRVLDRLVGYNLSPILWEKVKNGLSAGRVQSVALRLICDREKEVESFIPEEYWTLDAELQKDKHILNVQLFRVNGEKPVLQEEEDVLKIITVLEQSRFIVQDIKYIEKTIKPRPPFTTSTLQQTAANRLGFTSRKSMQIAQQLYEGVNIGAERIGLITYMRTDSTRISSVAVEEVRKYLAEHYPAELPEESPTYAVGKGAQDAHEAIRPTFPSYTPASIKEYLTKEQFRLYSIIWERFVSSQMIPAKTKTTAVDIAADECIFRASATSVVNKGFQKVLKTLKSKEKMKKLPPITIGDEFERLNFIPEQHFTSGPPRYTDASIIKALEEKGIGRPSTYAPIISVLLDRYYVVRKNKQLMPTTLGRIIYDLLMKNFPEVLNVNFTATMEEKLDKVEENKTGWVDIIKEFYGPFKSQVDHISESLESIKGILDEPTDYNCEKCGKQMIKKLGRYGFFLACSGFPECMNTKSVPLADCPADGCDGKIVARRKQGGRGKEFYGCTNYPECDFFTHFKPIATNCPKCGKFLVEKYDKKQGAHKSCINPECDYLHTHDEETENAD